MSEHDYTAWLLLGMLVGLVMILLLVRQIRRSQALLKAARNVQQKTAERPKYLDAKEGLSVLARLLLDDQLELSEACIRIKVLLDNLDPTLHQQQSLSIFLNMYEKLAHMPTHEARKRTDKRFVRKLDIQRFQLESDFREEIREGARQLLKLLDKNQ